MIETLDELHQRVKEYSENKAEKEGIGVYLITVKRVNDRNLFKVVTNLNHTGVANIAVEILNRELERRNVENSIENKRDKE